MSRLARKVTFAAIVASLLVACAPQREPQNLEASATGDAYQAQYRDPPVARDANSFLESPRINASKCRSYGRPGGGGKATGILPEALSGERLSRGDLVDVRTAEDELITGTYVVSDDGTLKLPFLPAIAAEGRSVTQIESDLVDELISAEFYLFPPVISVRVQDFSEVRVGVGGAVFEPQPVRIGGVQGDQVDALRQAALGASTNGRNLSTALRAAGGVRPDADLSSVELRRGGKLYLLDLRPLLTGRLAKDVMLLAGDEVNVPSRDCFQETLMVVSPISPPGITLFISNLTVPATANAQSAVGREVREVPYGTRYMQAVVDANCIGGTRATSADRAAILMSRNPITEVSVVVQRRLEDLLRRADRDDFDPYLLPGDAIACYDSSVTSIADLARIGAVIGAAVLLSSD